MCPRQSDIRVRRIAARRPPQALQLRFRTLLTRYLRLPVSRSSAPRVRPSRRQHFASGGVRLKLPTARLLKQCQGPQGQHRCQQDVEGNIENPQFIPQQHRNGRRQRAADNGTDLIAQ